MKNKRKDFVVTFKVNEEKDIINAFIALKTAEYEGIIGGNSKIEFDDICIPVEYFDSVTPIINFFRAIKSGNVDALIENLPNKEEASGYYDLFDYAMRKIPAEKSSEKHKKYHELFIKTMYEQAKLKKTLDQKERDNLVRVFVLAIK